MNVWFLAIVALWRLCLLYYFLKHFTQLSAGNITMIVVAIMLLAFFFSYFRMNYKWENNEQLYQELKAKEKKIMHAAS